MPQKSNPALILIIDDEESIRDGCSQALSKLGYNVITTGDGSEGIRIAREKRPDMAFIDLKMPGMSGLETMDILNRDIPNIVLIVVTGYATIVSAVEAMKRGAYDYLPKPFIPDQLRAVVSRGLEHRNLKIEARHLKEEKEFFEKGFITFVSHEMRSPLVTVQQYLESIKFIADDNLSQDILNIIDRCSKRIKNLEDMIEHWLDISRVENGSFFKESEPSDLSRIISWAVDDMQPLCEKRGLKILVKTPENLPTIMGDEESLLRVMINIIGNATKYTPPGGTINITTSYDEYYVRISIADTGQGIPQEKLPLIFEPFYRAKGKDERYRGSGLGLTFCKKIIDAHNGTIEALSTVGEGTTFILTLPR